MSRDPIVGIQGSPNESDDFFETSRRATRLKPPPKRSDVIANTMHTTTVGR